MLILTKSSNNKYEIINLHQNILNSCHHRSRVTFNWGEAFNSEVLGAPLVKIKDFTKTAGRAPFSFYKPDGPTPMIVTYLVHCENNYISPMEFARSFLVEI